MADPTWTVRPWQPGDSLDALTALLLDTAEPATALRQRDARAGSAHVACGQWQGKADRSVVMVQPLADPAPADTDPAHHRQAGNAPAGSA